MDIKDLMTEQGMESWAEEQSACWTNDAVEVRQLAQIFQARLKNQSIDGDNLGAAGRRARRVAGRITKAARHLEKAAAALQGANAFYVREVLELPERRDKNRERKELRRQRLGIAASSARAAIGESLTQSTTTLHHGPTPVGNPQVNPVGQAQPLYTNPAFYMPPAASGQGVPSIGDIFDQQATG